MPLPRDLQAFERVHAKDRVLSHLQRWIADGTIEPGERLRDAEIAAALGVSRTRGRVGAPRPLDRRG
jgi:DNA-binding GntR family transcriptional regulator